VAIEPVVIKPQFPALSKAGRWLVVLSVPWFFGAILALDNLGLIGRSEPQAQRWLALVVAAAPVVVLVFHPWLGRLPGLRWLHHQIQPRLVISPNGLDLQLRGVGTRFYDWGEVTGLRTRCGSGADLLGRGGVALARIPETMVLGGRGLRQTDSIATLVVRARPDRYGLSGANWAGVPNEFALRAPDDPQPPADRWLRRRRWTTVAIVLAFGAVTGLIIFVYLTR
jgi:hypothetical protein